MGLLSWIFTGLVAGILARLILPGRNSARVLATLVLGVAGAVLGGFLATLLGYGGMLGFEPLSLVTATLGAILVLQIMRLRRRS